jgi:hypothetical protein
MIYAFNERPSGPERVNIALRLEVVERFGRHPLANPTLLL